MTPGSRLLVAVAVGGAAGALLRWGAWELVPESPGFWWTTFTVNVVGAALLALLPALPPLRRHDVLVAGLGPGLLGGFTTLSATSEQAREAVAASGAGPAAAYLLGTLAASLAAVTAASLLADRLTGERDL